MDRLPSTEELKATLEARQEKLRQDWIKTMKARIVREELQKCHRAEGVNHYLICSDLAKKYRELLVDARVKGFRIIETQD